MDGSPAINEDTPKPLPRQRKPSQGAPLNSSATPSVNQGFDGVSDMFAQNIPLPDHDTPGYRGFSETSNSSSSSIDGERETRSHMNILAAIWKDDHLELYGTKCPVPTHLAHLAAMRALMHLRTDGWDDIGRTQTASAYLPDVHENVRNTLYCL